MHEGTKQSMLSFQHAHQQAGHGIACRGRFSDVQKTEELLWQAQRLIVDIENPLLIRQVGIPVQAPLSPESSAPRDYRYWVSPHETDDKKSRRFVDCIKNSKLCQYLLGAEDHGSRSSRQGWQLMNSTEAADAESAGRKLFGHPAVAYPDMEILTLLIRCDDTASEAKSALLRICICVDPASERRSCQICHSICMILDFIDEEGAVKLNIPLSDTSFPKSVSDLAEGPDYFSTSTWTRNATWADVDFLFQGMTKLQPHCYSHKMTKKNWILHDTHSSDMEDEEDRWDPDGNADSSIFEPVSDNRSSLFCLERNRLVNHDDEWDSDCGSSYTDEESPFEPFPDH